MDIGNRILAARKARNLRQNALAKMAGIANTTLNDIEKGRLTPSIKSLLKIAEALGLPPSYFLDNTPPRSQQAG